MCATSSPGGRGDSRHTHHLDAGAHGWVDCVVEDQRASVELAACHISNTPEEFLTAVVRLVADEREARVQFEAEPTAYRWIFYREAADAWIRLLELRHGSDHDRRGIEIWSPQLPVGEIAQAAVRCFDEVSRTYGESGYRSKWGEHLPRRNSKPYDTSGTSTALGTARRADRPQWLS